MNKVVKHIGTLLCLLAFFCTGYTQVSVRSNISRDNILIGEPISLTVEAYTPLGADIAWFNSDTIPHFDVMSRSPVDTAQNIDGKKITQSFVITSFDSGQQFIPSFDIAVAGQHYYTDSIPINVAFAPFNPEEDYRDIKDIIDIQNPNVRYIPWLLTTLAVLSLAIVALTIYKRSFAPPRVEREEPTPVLSPIEEAMKALATLAQRHLTNGEVKIYYSDMNDILRRYVARKFEISTFQRTNEELIVELSRIGIPRDAIVGLSQSLSMSDSVKFAKYQPSADDNKKNLTIVTSSIELLDKNVISAV
jgi:hypothetical protein